LTRSKIQVQKEAPKKIIIEAQTEIIDSGSKFRENYKLEESLEPLKAHEEVLKGKYS
jgi:hypothetical protein